jgi:hypothetical protein
MSEKRHHFRYVLWFPVTLVLPDGRAIGAICRDASVGGLLVSSPVLVAGGSPVTCSFRLSTAPSEKEQVTTGRILRCDRNDDDLELVFPYRVAVEFSPPPLDIEETLKRAESKLRPPGSP